jgi:hypothetical protein
VHAKFPQSVAWPIRTIFATGASVPHPQLPCPDPWTRG